MHNMIQNLRKKLLINTFCQRFQSDFHEIFKNGLGCLWEAQYSSLDGINIRA